MSKRLKYTETASEFVARLKKDCIGGYLLCHYFVTKHLLMDKTVDDALRSAACVKFANEVQKAVKIPADGGKTVGHWTQEELQEALVANGANNDELLSAKSIEHYKKTV
jgi:hypothetical protein